MAYAKINGYLPAIKSAESDMLALDKRFGAFYEAAKSGRSYPSIAAWMTSEPIWQKHFGNIWDVTASVTGTYGKDAIKANLDALAKDIDAYLKTAQVVVATRRGAGVTPAPLFGPSVVYWPRITRLTRIFRTSTDYRVTGSGIVGHSFMYIIILVRVEKSRAEEPVAWRRGRDAQDGAGDRPGLGDCARLPL